MKKYGKDNQKYPIKYHPAVKRDDISHLPPNIQNRIIKAIETRLTTKPEKYGIPLRGTLKKYWKLKVGDYRVVYKIESSKVIVLGIRHRAIDDIGITGEAE